MNARTVTLLLTAALVGSATAAAPPLPARTQETPSTSDEKLAALIARFNAKRKEVIDAYGKATSDDEKSKILAGMPGKDFVQEFRALAEEAKGTDAAARAWMWVLRLAADDVKQARQIVELLLADHMQSEAIAELPGYLRNHPERVEVLRAMVAESPHAAVRASALFALGTSMLGSKNDAERGEGRECLEKVAADYGDVAYGMSSTYRAAAEGYLYELDHLQLGMPAPDFQTVDENGAPWKLSDYKGKVVVVDFWGFW